MDNARLTGHLIESGASMSLQMITHLLRCHLFMEPIAVACRRQLPSLHPLWKLLSPHVRGVIAINTLGRERLIPAGGVADNTLSLGGGGLLQRKDQSFLSIVWRSHTDTREWKNNYNLFSKFLVRTHACKLHKVSAQ